MTDRDPRLRVFASLFSRPTINEAALRSLMFNGVPEIPLLRGVCWRMILGYLPRERAKWKADLESKRRTYHEDFAATWPFPAAVAHDAVDAEESDEENEHNSREARLVREIAADVRRTHTAFAFFRSGSADEGQGGEGKGEGGSEEGVGDATSVDSTTGQPVAEAAAEAAPSPPETNADKLKRILYIYAKLNPGLRYVQGMNELAAPILFVLSKAYSATCISAYGDDSESGGEAGGVAGSEAGGEAGGEAEKTSTGESTSEGTVEGTGKGTGKGTGESSADTDAGTHNAAPLIDADVMKFKGLGFDDEANVEADTFYCFSLLVTDARDFFIQTMDSTDAGLHGRCESIDGVLRTNDFELWQFLRTLDMAPAFIYIHWIATLLTREFDLPDVFRLWDALLSDCREELDTASLSPLAASGGGGGGGGIGEARARFELLHYICAGMVHHARSSILACPDFPSCMELLQRCPRTEVECLLETAARWRTSGRRHGSITPRLAIGTELGGTAAAAAGAAPKQSPMGALASAARWGWRKTKKLAKHNSSGGGGGGGGGGSGSAGGGDSGDGGSTRAPRVRRSGSTPVDDRRSRSRSAPGSEGSEDGGSERRSGVRVGGPGRRDGSGGGSDGSVGFCFGGVGGVGGGGGDELSSTFTVSYNAGSLGMGVVGAGSNPGVCVMSVKAGGQSFQDGRMQKGDRILAVNGIDTSSMTKNEALAVIKAAIVNPSTFTFGRRRRSKGGENGGKEEASRLKEIGSPQPPLDGDAVPLAGDGEDQQQPVSLPPAAARSSPP